MTDAPPKPAPSEPPQLVRVKILPTITDAEREGLLQLVSLMDANPSDDAIKDCLSVMLDALINQRKVELIALRDEDGELVPDVCQARPEPRTPKLTVLKGGVA